MDNFLICGIVKSAIEVRLYSYFNPLLDDSELQCREFLVFFARPERTLVYQCKVVAISAQQAGRYFPHPMNCATCDRLSLIRDGNAAKRNCPAFQPAASARKRTREGSRIGKHAGSESG
jgi:hypothetical protein